MQKHFKFYAAPFLVLVPVLLESCLEIICLYLHPEVLSLFSCGNFLVCDFNLNLIHFELTLAHGERYRYNFVLLKVAIQSCQHHLLNRLDFFF